MKQDEKKLSEGLKEAAEKCEAYYDVGEERGYLCTHRGDIKDAFIAGAEWQKERDANEALESGGSCSQMCYELGRKDMRKEMLEGAVDAYVKTYENIQDGANYVEFMAAIPAPNLNRREKVRIIIVKEDEK